MTSPDAQKLLQKMFSELRNIGYSVDSSHYFIDYSGSYSNAFPILLKYLQLIDDINHKDGLVRSLGVKGNFDAVPVLLDQYRKTTSRILKWSIGNTLSIIQDRTICDLLIQLLHEKSNVERPTDWPRDLKDPEVSAKETLLWALGATRDPKAVPILKEYLKHKDFAGHALEGLKYFKDPELISDIKPLLKHPQPWVRKKAERFIATLK